MHIWLTIPSLANKSGGPATVVQHLSEHLVAAGNSVTILTGAAEPGETRVVPRDSRAKVVSIARRTGAWRGKASEQPLRAALQAGMTTGQDHVLHDFGIWLYANHAAVSASREFGIPLVISTCGMLAPWALQHKRWKKRLAWWLYQRRDLSRAAVLVATAEQEAQDIRKRMPGKSVALVPNGVVLPEVGSQKAAGSDQARTVVFLGRIHPVKGLKNLVEAWSLIRPGGWRCVIAGPSEAGHQRELEEMLRERKLQNTFEFPGLLDEQAKWTLLKQADLFMLPSFSENFGVAAAEAMACGVPVISTKGTPWQELIEHRCGWWVDPDVQALAAALREATSRSVQERFEMGRRGRSLVEEKYSWPRIGSEMLSVYRWVLSQSSQPGCVSLNNIHERHACQPG